MSTFSTLYWWRLRHFAAATYKLLARRWQAALFVLFMASPAMMPLVEQIRLLGTPVLLIVQPGHLRMSASLWLLVLIAAWSWSALQSKALAGGKAWDHVVTMPLSARLMRRVDLAVLGTTDLPLFLPFFAAIATLLLEGPTRLDSVSAAVALVAQLPVAQWLVLRRSSGIAWCLAGSFGGVLFTDMAGTAWPLAAFALAGGAAGLATSTHHNSVKVKPSRAAPLVLRLHERRAAAVNLMTVNVRFLFGSRQFSQHLGLLLCLPLPLLLLEFLRWAGVKDAVVRLVLILCMVPLLFQLAGLAFDLRRLHAPMQRLYAATGLRQSLLTRVNLIVIEALFALFSLPLVWSTYVATGSASALWTLPVGMVAVGLIAWLNHRDANSALVPKLLVSALACALLMQLIGS